LQFFQPFGGQRDRLYEEMTFLEPRLVLKSGLARAKKSTKKARSDIARKAAKTGWSKRDGKKEERKKSGAEATARVQSDLAL